MATRVPSISDQRRNVGGAMVRTTHPPIRTTVTGRSLGGLEAQFQLAFAVPLNKRMIDDASLKYINRWQPGYLGTSQSEARVTALPYTQRPNPTRARPKTPKDPNPNPIATRPQAIHAVAASSGIRRVLSLSRWAITLSPLWGTTLLVVRGRASGGCLRRRLLEPPLRVALLPLPG